MKHLKTIYILPLLLLALWLNAITLHAQNEPEELEDYEEFDWEESEPVTSALITHDGNYEMANSVVGYWDKTNDEVVITLEAQENYLAYQLVVKLKGGKEDLIGPYEVTCGETINHGAIIDYSYDMEEQFDLETLETVADYSKTVSTADCKYLANKSSEPFKVTKSVPFEEEVSGIWGQTSTQKGYYIDLEGSVNIKDESLKKFKIFEVNIKHLRVVVL